MMNKKPVRFSVLLIVSILSVLMLAFHASAYAYFVETFNNTITKNEAATFRIIVQNTADYEDYYTFSTRDVNWILNVDPASALVPANSEKEFIASLSPKPLVNEGRTYFIPVKIKSEKSGFYFEEEKKFAVYVVDPSLKGGVYPITVTPVVSIENTIDPREKVSVRVVLRNRNVRDIEDLKVVVNGEVFYKEYVTKLLPLEEKTNEILFEIDPLTEPGIKTLTLTIFSAEGKNEGESTSEYEIIGYADLQKTESKSTVFFRTAQKFSIVNNGNEKATAEHKFSLNIIQRLFTKFTPDAVKEKGADGKSYYVIRQELGSEQVLEGKAVTNYRIIVLIIAIIIVIIVLYYVLRSPLIIVKSAEPLGRTENGLSEVKIRLYIKNRSRKQLASLRVVDVVPSIAEIDRKTHLGSMEPVSIGKGKRGTVPRWEMEALEAYEERIITYRIKSKLTLIGGIRLPSAKAMFDEGQGKERVTYSNAVNLMYRIE
ncbi:hypothetical protein JW756_01050 [Candidatus Woesearchaeota archaeon]|nr:hypothetical protein [Candidatus Woesearchaeota archaeon]